MSVRRTMTWFLLFASNVVVNSVVRDSVNSSDMAVETIASISVLTAGVSKPAVMPIPNDFSVPEDVDLV